MVKKIAAKLDIASWVAINQIVPLPIETWLGEDEWQRKYGLDNLVKRAIAKEVEEVVRQRESARREAERKFEMEKMQTNQKLQFPQQASSTIGQFLSR